MPRAFVISVLSFVILVGLAWAAATERPSFTVVTTADEDDLEEDDE